MAIASRPHAGHPRSIRHGDRFERVSAWAARGPGCRWGFRLALALILAWAAAGPYFGYHASWTTAFTVATTSITFLLVFLIQGAQSRELKAIHLKLDELILAAESARNELIDIENLTEAQLDRLGRRYSRLAASYHGSAATGRDHAAPPSGAPGADA
jgi:low affinity Fe/Cu permease